MNGTPNHRFWRKIAVYLGRLSIQRKITFVILLSFILTLPPVILSIHYLSRILEEINFIIEEDVAVGRNAADLSLLMLDTRRYERIYLLIGGEAERDTVFSQLKQARELLKNAAGVADQSGLQLIRYLQDDLAKYEKNFGLLIQFMNTYPPLTAEQFPEKIAPELEKYRVRYRDLLVRLEEANPSERDSLVAHIDEQLQMFTSELLGGTGAVESGISQLTDIQDNLDLNSEEFQGNARKLAEYSWGKMQEHRIQSFYIEARAKLNIFMVVILTAFLYLYMLTSMPRQIIKPVTRLNALLRKAIAGDFREHAREYSNDEIGDLAANYNHVLDRFSQFDEMKTRKIGSQKRMIDRFLEMIPSAVCMMSANMVLLYYNQSFADLFPGILPPKPPETGIELTKVEGMENLVGELHDVLGSTKTEFSFTIKARNGESHRFKGRLIRNPLMEQESVLIMDVPLSQSTE